MYRDSFVKKRTCKIKSAGSFSSFESAILKFLVYFLRKFGASLRNPSAHVFLIKSYQSCLISYIRYNYLFQHLRRYVIRKAIRFAKPHMIAAVKAILQNAVSLYVVQLHFTAAIGAV